MGTSMPKHILMAQSVATTTGIIQVLVQVITVTPGNVDIILET